MFLTWIIDLQHHVGLEAETLEAAQLDRLDHGDVQQPVPGVQRANVVHSRLNQRILTKSWIHLQEIENKESVSKCFSMHTFFLELDFSLVSVFTNTGKFGTVLGLNN